MISESKYDTYQIMEESAETTAIFPDEGPAKGTKSYLYHYYEKGNHFWLVISIEHYLPSHNHTTRDFLA